MISKREIHQIAPIYDINSRSLILGSFPSVKSREHMFFYSHPQNRFWKLIADVFDASLPKTEEDKRRLLLSHRIALWDVVGVCDITGSSDSSINNVIPNDIGSIIEGSDIQAVFTNGKKAYELYMKFTFPLVNIHPICLPSSSPANASVSYEVLLESWKVIKNNLP